VLPEGLFLNFLGHEFNDERTFENSDEQFDLIRTLSAHELKRLHNHISKVTAATSVNDVMSHDCQCHEYGPTETNNEGIQYGHAYQDIMDILLEKESDELKNWRLKKLDNRNVLFFKGKNYRDFMRPLNELLEKDRRHEWNKK
jgi:hypothetical protein